jgi:hypothetical protein
MRRKISKHRKYYLKVRNKILEYKKGYYLKNREKILAYKRNRYRCNKAFRDNIKSRAYSERDRIRKKFKEINYIPVVAKVMVKGELKDIKLYKIGALANFIGRTTKTVRTWEAKGSMPPTPFRGLNGHRFYSFDMIESVKYALDALNGDVRCRDKKFWIKVVSLWRILGVL